MMLREGMYVCVESGDFEGSNLQTILLLGTILWYIVEEAMCGCAMMWRIATTTTEDDSVLYFYFVEDNIIAGESY